MNEVIIFLVKKQGRVIYAAKLKMEMTQLAVIPNSNKPYF